LQRSAYRARAFSPDEYDGYPLNGVEKGSKLSALNEINPVTEFATHCWMLL
jgi:hypothetical protein